MYYWKGFWKHNSYAAFLSLSPPSLDHPIMMGFEPLVNQRLLPPTFPRYAKIIKREEMVNYFSKLIDRIKTVCEVVNLSNLHCILVSMSFSYLLPEIRSEDVTCKKIIPYMHALAHWRENWALCMYLMFLIVRFNFQIYYPSW